MPQFFYVVLCLYAWLTLLYSDILTPSPRLTHTSSAQSLYNSFRPPNCPTPSIVCTCSSAVTVSCARIMYVACLHSLKMKNVSLSLPRTHMLLALIASIPSSSVLTVEASMLFVLLSAKSGSGAAMHCASPSTMWQRLVLHPSRCAPRAALRPRMLQRRPRSRVLMIPLAMRPRLLQPKPRSARTRAKTRRLHDRDNSSYSRFLDQYSPP